MTYEEEIAKHEEAIAALVKARDEEMKAKRDAVKPRYTFTLTKCTDPYRKSGDPTCVWYRLTGTVDNAAELNDVGIRPFVGGMDYLFNTVSERFIIDGGSGSIFLRFIGDYRGEKDTEAFDELAAYLAENPEGGVVTEIVEHYRSKRK